MLKPRARHCLPGLTRREFLKASALAAGGLAGGSLGCTPGPILEGIYTDRFTYRQGQPIRFHGALTSGVPATVRVRSLDFSHSAWTWDVAFGQAQNRYDPGMFGAQFEVGLEIDSASLPIGIYEVSIPDAALEPQNLENTATKYTHKNNLARFVVTAPAPGSHSPILFIYDTGTAISYASFGARSIYGQPPVRGPIVSWLRPGMNQSQKESPVARFLRQSGHELEYIDPVALDAQASGFLDSYRLVIALGQLEYLSNGLVAELERYVEAGGNLLCASHEFGVFRVRLDHASATHTTFKGDFPFDPCYGVDDAQLAGVGMLNPAAVFETQPFGQTTLAALRNLPGETRDLTLANTADLGWILQGTGLGDGDVLADALGNFNSGTLVGFDAVGRPFAEPSPYTRQHPSTVVWGLAPAADAEMWWGTPDANGYLPKMPDGGWATATFQQRDSGGRVVSFPTGGIFRTHLGMAVYEQILLNIVAALTA